MEDKSSIQGPQICNFIYFILTVTFNKQFHATKNYILQLSGYQLLLANLSKHTLTMKNVLH